MKRYNPIDIDALRAIRPLSSVVGQVVQLKRRGGGYMGCCPFHPDRTPSLSVSDELGLFHCFGCGAKGDVIGFVQAHQNVDFLAAIDILANGAALGNVRPPRAAKAAKRSDGVAHANEIWNGSSALVGSLAERYLAQVRYLPLDRLPPMPNIRFARTEYRGGSRKHPALVAAVRSLDGRLTGIQRTFLTDAGEKLPVDTPKMSRGDCLGGAIRIGRSSDELIVTEGIEDALAVLSEAPSASAWVAAGAGMMAKMLLPETCQIVTIAADNDEPGQRAAEAAAAAFDRPGRRVRIISPSPKYKDFNEQLIAESAA